MVTSQSSEITQDREIDDLASLSLSEQADYWAVRLDGGLDPLRAEQFQNWVGQSPAHKQAFGVAMEVWSMTSLAAQSYVDAYPTADDELLKSAQPVAVPRRGLLVRWASAALVILLMGLIAWQSDLVPSSNQVVAAQDFKQVTLADGSLAVLDAQATVDIDYNRESRIVELRRGGVFVTVQSNKKRPFIVKLGDVQVRAVGTAYSVERTGSRRLVTVQEGVVSIERGGADKNPVRLTAGHSWSLTDGAKRAVTSADVKANTAYWQRQKLVAAKMPLNEVLQKLSRHAGENPLWISDDLSQITVSGVFQLSNAGALSDILLKRYGIEKYNIFGNRIIFLKKN